MDIEEDSQVHIIVGRPFLRTIDAIIIVKREKLTFEVGNEMIEFIMTSVIKYPYKKVSFYLVDAVKACDETKPKQSTLKVKQKPSH